MEFSLVVPCYNESANLPLLFSRLREVFDNRHDFECVLVDNGSTDDSPEVFAAELKKHGDLNVRVHRVEVNRGYGYGILSGLSVCTGKVLGWTHADLQTDLNDAVLAYDLYVKAREERRIVKGKRKNRRLLETFFTLGMQVVASVVLKTWMDDINAQPKLFPRDLYEKHLRENAPNDFSLDLFLLYTAKKEKYHIIKFPVYFNKRLHGEAKGGGSWKTRIKLIKRTFGYIFELKRTLKNQRSDS